MPRLARCLVLVTHNGDNKYLFEKLILCLDAHQYSKVQMITGEKFFTFHLLSFEERV